MEEVSRHLLLYLYLNSFFLLVHILCRQNEMGNPDQTKAMIHFNTTKCHLHKRVCYTSSHRVCQRCILHLKRSMNAKCSIERIAFTVGQKCFYYVLCYTSPLVQQCLKCFDPLDLGQYLLIFLRKSKSTTNLVSLIKCSNINVACQVVFQEWFYMQILDFLTYEQIS